MAPPEYVEDDLTVAELVSYIGLLEADLQVAREHQQRSAFRRKQCHECGGMYSGLADQLFCTKTCEEDFDKERDIGRALKPRCDGCHVRMKRKKLDTVLCTDGETRKYCSQKCADAHQNGLGLVTTIHTVPVPTTRDFWGRGRITEEYLRNHAQPLVIAPPPPPVIPLPDEVEETSFTRAYQNLVDTYRECFTGAPSLAQRGRRREVPTWVKDTGWAMGFTTWGVLLLGLAKWIGVM